MADKIEHEKEYKFLTNPATIAAILDLDEIAGSKRTNLNFFQQVDFYYDTEDLFFYHQGLQFRIRQKDGNSHQATLKLPTGTQEETYDRTEHSTKLVLTPEFFQDYYFDRSRVSPQLEEKLTHLIGQKKLCLTLKVFNDRQIISLDNQLLIFLDNIAFHHPKHINWHPGYEIEIEAGPGSIQDLQTVAKYLQKQYSLILSPEPKYQRGLAKFIK